MSICTEDFVSSTLIVPLPGLVIEGRRFRLDERIEFGDLTDRELEECADMGLFTPTFPTSAHIAGRQGCRITFRTPAVRRKAGDDADLPSTSDGASRSFGEPHWWSPLEVWEEVLATLRLWTKERIVSRGAFLRADGYLRGGYQIMHRRAPPMGSTGAVLDRVTQRAVKRTWAALLEASPKHSMPRTCLRRLNAAEDRLNMEESFVDLMIVAEALFLNDGSDRSELAYRSSLRGAKLLEREGFDARSARQVLSQGYNLRSRVVHGGELPETVPLTGGRVAVAEFHGQLTAVVKAALRVAARLYVTDPTFAGPEYWEDLVLRRTRRSSG